MRIFAATWTVAFADGPIPSKQEHLAPSSPPNLALGFQPDIRVWLAETGAHRAF